MRSAQDLPAQWLLRDEHGKVIENRLGQAQEVVILSTSCFGVAHESGELLLSEQVGLCCLSFCCLVNCCREGELLLSEQVSLPCMSR